MTHGPLSGFTIGVTADRRADEQMKLLNGRGAECLHGPVIKTHPIDSEEALGAATRDLIDDPPEVVVLTTGLGARSWLEAADALHLGEGLQDVLEHAELYARGPKARGALVTAGFDVVNEEPLGQYSLVLEALAARNVEDARIAVQLDGAGAGELCEAIEAMGARVARVPVYKWSLPEDTTTAERLVRATVEHRVDAVTFTARPAVDNFLEIAGMMGVHDEVVDALAGDVVPVCVGPVCATGITDVGLPDPLQPDRFRLGAMVQLVANHFADKARQVELAGSCVRVQGRLALVGDGEEAWLTDRERAILDALIERPGVVLSKRDLLRRVWHGLENDEHVVEVTVARLRQRLGPASAGIETVVRRGYRVSSS